MTSYGSSIMMRCADCCWACGCKWRCDNTKGIWTVAYSVMVTVSLSYLIYQAVVRYLVYRDIVPDTAIYHIIFTCIAAVLLPIIVLLSFLKLGTYTNDALQVGMSSPLLALEPTKYRLMKSLYICSPPFGQMLHIIAAYLLLIPNVFTISIGKKRQLLTSGDTGWQGFLSTGPVWVLKTHESPDPTNNWTQLPPYSTILPSNDLELLNLLVALFIYYARSAATFWSANKWFALAFGLQMVMNMIVHLLSYLGFSLLYSQIVLDSYPSRYLLTAASLTTLYIIGNAVLFTSCWCAFYFGYTLVQEKIQLYISQQGLYGKTNGAGVCVPYTTHSLAVVAIVVFIGLNAPIMYDYVTAYGESYERLLMVHLTMNVLYMMFWLALWLSFTVKQKWQFEVDEEALLEYVREKWQVQQDSNSEESPESMNSNTEEKFNTELALSVGDDDSSGSVLSANAGVDNSPSSAGILSSNGLKLKRKCGDQKVKFQAATRIIIETNLDSDLDTIPESDHENADSAVFSGSGDSSNSNDSSQPAVTNNGIQQAANNDLRLILNPQLVQYSKGSYDSRIWSSTGDLDSRASKKQSVWTPIPSPRKKEYPSHTHTISKRVSDNVRSSKNHQAANYSSSCMGFHPLNNDCLSTAV